MKPNYIPPENTYAPAEVAERNNYIDELCAGIQGHAGAAFESAVARQTINESATELAEEARAALLEVLVEQPERLLDEETVRLTQALAGALKLEPQTPDKASDAAWMERRSKDLARSVVGFWVNLGERETSRYRASIRLLDDMVTGTQSESKRSFELICSRFWLDANEAGGLLSRLNGGVLMRALIRIAKIWIDTATVDALWKKIPAEPSPEFVKAAAHSEHSFLEVMLHAIDGNSAEYDSVVRFTTILGDIHRDERARIEAGDAALRKQRMAAYCNNTALVCGAVRVAAAYCKDRRSISIQAVPNRQEVKASAR
jgi:hypothetical protein